jgi:hypothetical protein
VVTRLSANDLSAASERAFRIWQVLVRTAANGETITYGDLTKVTGILPPQGMGKYLNRIKEYCSNNNLPPLHVLAVRKSTGRPGAGLVVKDFRRDCKLVFQFNWIGLVSPTPADFTETAKQEKRG